MSRSSIVIAALTRGLDDAQDTALDPLSSIGTDLTVTLAPSEDAGGGFGPGGGGGGREVVQANSSVITDLSKLGRARREVRPHVLPAGDAAHVRAEPGA